VRGIAGLLGVVEVEWAISALGGSRRTRCRCGRGERKRGGIEGGSARVEGFGGGTKWRRGFLIDYGGRVGRGRVCAEEKGD
jgi:hypothetical protein